MIDAVKPLPSPRHLSGLPGHLRARRGRHAVRCALALLAASALAGAAAAAPSEAAEAAGTSLSEDLLSSVHKLAGDAALLVWPASGKPPRVEVVVGQLNPRLRLAPCEQIVPFLPPGARPLGSTRIGLRCAKGAVAWRVTLPMSVKVWAPALVARTTLPAGTVLQANQLVNDEVDVAARADAAIVLERDAVGRTLQRGLAAGDTLRTGDIKVRIFFQAGDTVRVVAGGNGFSVSGEGQALSPGSEGRNAQVKLSSGRVITGVATAERQVEVAL